MGKPRLQIAERKVIEKMLYNKETYQEIARQLNRTPSSINREIERNMTNEGKYCAECAQAKYELRKISRTRYVTQNPVVIEFVKMNLINYSPDAIAGRARMEKHPIRISTESVYKIIYTDSEQSGNLYLHLPSKRKKRKISRFSALKTAGTLNNQRSIRDRPISADNKTRHGHFEGDTIVGKDHKSMCFTAIDRKTKFGFVHKLKTRDSRGVFEAVLLMKKVYGDKIKTLTVDNGKEFACHEQIADELNIDVFFADPGKPSQRGLNEHFNKLLRRYLPKGIDFRKVSWQYVRNIMTKINNTPRKSLQYRTPSEAAGFNQFRAILN